jgi:hypothetical protein
MSIINRSNVYSAVYSFINSALSISVFENEAPQDKRLPLAVYSGVGDVPVYDMNGKESLDADFQVSFFGDKKLGSATLRAHADTLINALDRATINITGYDNEIAFVTVAGVMTIEDDIIQIRTEFNLKGF